MVLTCRGIGIHLSPCVLGTEEENYVFKHALLAVSGAVYVSILKLLEKIFSENENAPS